MAVKELLGKKLDKVLCHKTSWIYFTLDTEKYNNNVSYNNNLVNNGLNQLTRGIPTGSRGRGNLSVRAQSIEREYKQMGKVTLTSLPPDKNPRLPRLGNYPKWINMIQKNLLIGQII